MTLESIPLDGTNGVRIEILERSDTTLVIRWVEPGRCHYGEQRWRRRSAHTSGTCAVTRRKIRRGDAVFKPAERPAPANASGHDLRRNCRRATRRSLIFLLYPCLHAGAATRFPDRAAHNPPPIAALRHVR